MSDLGHGTSTNTCYAIEGRTTLDVPVSWNGVLYGKEWKRIEVSRSPDGVPNLGQPAEAQVQGYMSHATALALAHEWLVPASWDKAFLRMEVRLIGVTFQMEWSAAELGVGQPIGSERHAALTPRKAVEA